MVWLAFGLFGWPGCQLFCLVLFAFCCQLESLKYSFLCAMCFEKLSSDWGPAILEPLTRGGVWKVLVPYSYRDSHGHDILFATPLAKKHITSAESLSTADLRVMSHAAWIEERRALATASSDVELWDALQPTHLEGPEQREGVQGVLRLFLVRFGSRICVGTIRDAKLAAVSESSFVLLAPLAL